MSSYSVHSRFDVASNLSELTEIIEKNSNRKNRGCTRDFDVASFYLLYLINLSELTEMIEKNSKRKNRGFM